MNKMKVTITAVAEERGGKLIVHIEQINEFVDMAYFDDTDRAVISSVLSKGFCRQLAQNERKSCCILTGKEKRA